MEEQLTDSFRHWNGGDTLRPGVVFLRLSAILIPTSGRPDTAPCATAQCRPYPIPFELQKALLSNYLT